MTEKEKRSKGKNMGKRWIRKTGYCEHFKSNGYIYSIQGTLAGNWHIIKTELLDSQDRHTCKTFKQLFEEIARLQGWGHHTTAKSESAYKYEVVFLTKHANAGSDDLRTFEATGKNYAVDLRVKQYWRYPRSKVISPDFSRYAECKEWAEDYIRDEIQPLF